MRLLLVSPPFGEKGQTSKGLPIAPPVLEYLAGLTRQLRPDVEIALVDANKDEVVPERVEADLVGFTVLTPQSPWVYRTSDRLRGRGIQVVLGGIHVRACPDEASAHADALVIGEAEGIWGQLLDDAAGRRLKPIYHDELPPLEGLPRPLTGLLRHTYPFGAFFTARGCPHRCTFCSVHEYFGDRVRFRPVKEVAEEVAASSRRLFWNIDDNVWGTRLDRSVALFREMSQTVRGKWWFGSTDLVTVQNPRGRELVRWARKAGCTAVLVGWESNNREALREYKALAKQGADRLDALKLIRDGGVEVMLFIMVGGRQDRPEDYDGIRELCLREKVSAHPVMTTPFPGTELHEAYRPHFREGLSWDWYDGNHAVFRHDDPAMNETFREDALMELRADLFRLPLILGRLTKIGWRGFPMSHITSWMLQYPQGRAFREFAREHRAMRRAEGASR
jgi:radical SAM superfamily enzyme YgiQ (UPF0313 family)